MRVAFAGQSTYFEACALPDGAAPGTRTRFVEFRQDGDPDRMVRELRAFRPDVVACFRPEIFPAGCLKPLGVPVLGFLTEPLPRTAAGGVPHEDLEQRLDVLRHVDASQFDRVVAFDPFIIAAAAEVLPVWRALPLPVDDRFFAPVRRVPGGPRALFVGRSTKHRERLLIDAKHHHDVLHVAHGVDATGLRQLMEQHDIGINLHNEPYPSFENRVCLHLAAGHLVFSEPLSPTHGLEPGIDFLEIRDGQGLHLALWTLARHPDAWQAVRLRGRRKAEQFRASRVWPRLLGDLQRELAAPMTRAG
ncbi:MAG TPA: hypothetical protein VD931_09805 [Baekduia sp.]|nr:hypothetical protein [Baekduia sp.]